MICRVNDKFQGIKGVKRTKPMVWVDGGIHAREWITVSSCMYLIKQVTYLKILYESHKVQPEYWIDNEKEFLSSNISISKLLEGYGHDNNITDLMDSVKFSLQPLSNPDGYVYSWLVGTPS